MALSCLLGKHSTRHRIGNILLAGFLVAAAGLLSPARAQPTPDSWHLQFVNKCPDPVRIGVNGGAVTTGTDSATLACGVVDPSNAQSCPAGSHCKMENGTASGCYWGQLRFSGPGYLPPGVTLTEYYYFPAYNNIRWSGNVYAGGQCSFETNSCKTGVCATSENGHTIVGPCPFGVGPVGPTTLAEFTLLEKGVDAYDISIINGMNIPISMEPIAAAEAMVNATAGGGAGAANPYYCGAAGAASQPAGSTLTGCSWDFDPKVKLPGSQHKMDYSDLLSAVTPGGTACQPAGGTGPRCPTGEVCGRAFTPGTTTAPESCGKQIGWWTADELCIVTNNGEGSPLDCSTTVTGQGTRADLLGCTGSNAGSCYSAGAGSSCCGCPDWKVGGTDLPLAPGFSCQGTNPEWTSHSEPWAKVLKDACPTAYSFPYDDPTSSFTCSTDSTGASKNTMSYKITFCPDSKTGI